MEDVEVDVDHDQCYVDAKQPYSGKLHQRRAVEVGMSQVDSLRDCLFYSLGLYTQVHGLCIL